RDKVIAEEVTQVVHEFVIDFVDTEAEAVDTIFGYQFALQSVHPFNKVVETFKKCAVTRLLGANANEHFAGKPAPFIVGIQDLEIAAFDFDDQPQLFGKLQLVSIVFRSAIDEVADVNWTRLHPRVEAVCTAQTN